MSAHTPLYTALRGLLGEDVEYRGHRMRIIDVLSDGPSLVLADQGTEIQADLHGDPRRRVQRTLTIRALDDGTHLSAVLGEALSTDQLRRLSALAGSD